MTLCDPWTTQPLEFSRPEYWSGESFSSPGIEPRSPSLQADSLPAEPLGKPPPHPFFFHTSFLFSEILLRSKIYSLKKCASSISTVQRLDSKNNFAFSQVSNKQNENQKCLQKRIWCTEHNDFTWLVMLCTMTETRFLDFAGQGRTELESLLQIFFLELQKGHDPVCKQPQ